LSFEQPLLGGSMGGRKPGRFHASGFPVRQPVEPPPSIGVECGGFSKSKPLEAIDGSRPPVPFAPHSATTLALQACDDIDNLHDVRLAYACIEKLVDPQHVSDSEELHPIRTELGALMRLVNEELRRRIEASDATMQSLRLALG
jgi:hypothetical protein